MSDPRPPAGRTASSSIATGTAAAFVMVASVVGFLADTSAPVGSSWHLRGTLAPMAEAPAHHARLPLQAFRKPV